MDTEARSLVRLMTWLSPAFPVGGFAYSSGLERAVHDGLISDAADLVDWLEAILGNGAQWNDAVLLAEAWRAHDDDASLATTIELAQALAGSAERHAEIMTQGEAFMAAASAWPSGVLARPGRSAPYAVAVGAVAAAHGLALDNTLAAYVHAISSQAVSAAIRLGVLGQRQGVETLARLEPVILELADRVARSSLEDLGSATIVADLESMRHETQHSRLFRS